MTPDSHEILASLCFMGKDSEGAALFAFVSKTDEPLLQEAAKKFTDEHDPTTVNRQSLVARLSQLHQIHHRSALDSVHPGWILEALSEESPRLMGILCRLLSGDQARHIIERAKGRLPKMEETYRVPEPIIDVVWKYLEKKFQLQAFSRLTGSFSFPHLVVLKGDDWRTLFRDLGLGEIRKAFSQVEPNVLRAFLSRFPPKEAQEIRQRIEEKSAVPEATKREAQSHLIAMPLDQLSSTLLLLEIGYSVFAKALLPSESFWAERVWTKLPPEEGYRLKRIVQETSTHRYGEDVLEARREEVISRVFTLAQSGLIRYYWKKG